MSDEEVKDFVAKYFSKYFKYITKGNLRKFAKSLDIFLKTSHEVEKYVQSNTSDKYVYHYNV